MADGMFLKKELCFYLSLFFLIDSDVSQTMKCRLQTFHMLLWNVLVQFFLIKCYV